MERSAGVLLATIGAAHGVRGEVRVRSFTSDVLGLGAYNPLRTADGRDMHIEQIRPAKDILVVKFRGIESREAAQTLNGASLFVDRQYLPQAAEDEFYHTDLIGLLATTQAGERFGKVTSVLDFGAGEMLEIASASGPTVLIPFTREAVPDIDIAAGRVTIIPPIETEPAEDDQAVGEI